jgi:hypothetical protein
MNPYTVAQLLRCQAPAHLDQEHGASHCGGAVVVHGAHALKLHDERVPQPSEHCCMQDRDSGSLGNQEEGQAIIPALAASCVSEAPEALFARGVVAATSAGAPSVSAMKPCSSVSSPSTAGLSCFTATASPLPLSCLSCQVQRQCR